MQAKCKRETGNIGSSLSHQRPSLAGIININPSTSRGDDKNLPTAFSDTAASATGSAEPSTTPPTPDGDDGDDEGPENADDSGDSGSDAPLVSSSSLLSRRRKSHEDNLAEGGEGGNNNDRPLKRANVESCRGHQPEIKILDSAASARRSRRLAARQVEEKQARAQRAGQLESQMRKRREWDAKRRRQKQQQPDRYCDCASGMTTKSEPESKQKQKLLKAGREEEEEDDGENDDKSLTMMNPWEIAPGRISTGADGASGSNNPPYPFHSSLHYAPG